MLLTNSTANRPRMPPPRIPSRTEEVQTPRIKPRLPIEHILHAWHSAEILSTKNTRCGTSYVRCDVVKRLMCDFPPALVLDRDLWRSLADPMIGP